MTQKELIFCERLGKNGNIKSCRKIKESKFE